MKKITIVFVLLLSFSKISIGQTYYPMLADSTKWYVTLYNLETYTEVRKTDGDTIINGLNYKKFYEQDDNPSPYYFIREDTITRKIYRLLTLETARYFNLDSIETIFYDFSLKENDSIYLTPDPHWNYNGGLFSVDSIRTLNTILGLRNALYLSPNGYYPTIIWVEGVGSLGGFMNRGLGGYYESLTCFYYNDEKVYESEEAKLYNNCNIAIGIENFNIAELITIFPNPASTTINIDLPDNNNFQLILYNSLGKQLLLENNKRQVDVSGLENGVYFVNILMEKEVVSRRFVICK